jgi:hypothetical protein
VAKLKSSGSGELRPITAGHGPVLRFSDHKIAISLGSSNTSTFDVGQQSGQAAGLAKYTSVIADDSPDALTMAGKTVQGLVLVDANGEVLARLASDDESVYRPADVGAFARIAQLSLNDWGEVPSAKIDALLEPTRQWKKARRTGATRREWLIAAAIGGGILTTWPTISHLTFQSTRTMSLVVFALGLGGFAIGALALVIGRFAARLPDKLVSALCWTLAAATAVASLATQLNGLTIWKLSTGQTGASILGLAVILAVIPLWARANRENAG